VARNSILKVDKWDDWGLNLNPLHILCNVQPIELSSLDKIEFNYYMQVSEVVFQKKVTVPPEAI
jgi:hypothetical protein